MRGCLCSARGGRSGLPTGRAGVVPSRCGGRRTRARRRVREAVRPLLGVPADQALYAGASRACDYVVAPGRSEEHTSELQSLMRISYAVFCLKKKKITINKSRT